MAKAEKEPIQMAPVQEIDFLAELDKLLEPAEPYASLKEAQEMARRRCPEADGRTRSIIIDF